MRKQHRLDKDQRWASGDKDWLLLVVPFAYAPFSPWRLSWLRTGHPIIRSTSWLSVSRIVGDISLDTPKDFKSECFFYSIASNAMSAEENLTSET